MHAVPHAAMPEQERSLQTEQMHHKLKTAGSIQGHCLLILLCMGTSMRACGAAHRKGTADQGSEPYRCFPGW